ncbi:site-specific DNA-methyltransferase, partial [Xenorhabdus sp. XENO-10]
PCKEESVNWDTTGNLFIEGDNLEVLKLLQKSYHKKIKMIYIDPPYNTGNNFIYKDNYHDTKWLNMLYPRLKLARDLLSDEGMIFISIDDHEVVNLSNVCNEIFGEDNFVER